MLKKILPLLTLLLITGCAGTFSRLTPLVQVRNDNNLYSVEVAFTSSQQSLRWDSIQANIQLRDGSLLPMRKVMGVPNRWEGLVPVPAGQDAVSYRVKFDYLVNTFGKPPQPTSSVTPVYTLRVFSQ
jgi:hypothetical protein